MESPEIKGPVYLCKQDHHCPNSYFDCGDYCQLTTDPDHAIDPTDRYYFIDGEIKKI